MSLKFPSMSEDEYSIENKYLNTESEEAEINHKKMAENANKMRSFYNIICFNVSLIYKVL